MAEAAKAIGRDEAVAAPTAPPGRRKLLLLALPVVLLVVVTGGLWFTGVLPRLLGHGASAKAANAGPALPVYLDMPDVVANLDAGAGQDSFVKMQVRLLLASAADRARVTAVMPQILDFFQTYLRAMRPADLRAADGTYRLREELLARVNIAAAPARVEDVLFTQVLVQ